MKIECAWCGKNMGEKDGEGIEGVSHSVCEECYEKMTPDAQKNMRQAIIAKRNKARSSQYVVRCDDS